MPVLRKNIFFILCLDKDKKKKKKIKKIKVFESAFSAFSPSHIPTSERHRISRLTHFETLPTPFSRCETGGGDRSNLKVFFQAVRRKKEMRQLVHLPILMS